MVCLAVSEEEIAPIAIASAKGQLRFFDVGENGLVKTAGMMEKPDNPDLCLELSTARNLVSMAWSQAHILATGCTSGTVEASSLVSCYLTENQRFEIGVQLKMSLNVYTTQSSHPLRLTHFTSYSGMYPLTVSSLAWHPSRPDIFMAGLSNGHISLWDIRNVWRISEQGESLICFVAVISSVDSSGRAQFVWFVASTILAVLMILK